MQQGLSEHKKTLIFCEGVWAQLQIVQGDCAVYFLRHIDKTPRHGPIQQALGVPTWQTGLKQMTSRLSFLAEPFCDSVIPSFQKSVKTFEYSDMYLQFRFFPNLNKSIFFTFFLHLLLVSNQIQIWATKRAWCQYPLFQECLNIVLCHVHVQWKCISSSLLAEKSHQKWSIICWQIGRYFKWNTVGVFGRSRFIQKFH